MKKYLKPFFNKGLYPIAPPIALGSSIIETMGVLNIHDTSESYIHLPIEIDLKSLQNKLNKDLRNGIKIIDIPDFFSINSSFGVSHVCVYKMSDLVIATIEGMLYVTIHIKLDARVHYTSSALGKGDYDVSGSAIIKMISSLDLSDNLELNPSSTRFEIEKITDWGAQSVVAEAPPVAQPANDWWSYLMGSATSILNYTKDSVGSVLSYVGKLVSAPILNNLIIPNYLNAYIFDYIAENYCSKQAVIRRLYDVCKATEVNTYYGIWYAIQPQTIYVNRPTIAAGKIKINLEAHARFETSVGQKPYLRFNGDLIRVESHSTVPVGDFKACLPICMSYLGITNMVRHNLLGRYITINGVEDKGHVDGTQLFSTTAHLHGVREKIANKIVGSSCINGVRVYKGPGSLVMIDLKLKGSFNGNYKLAFSPVYDVQKEEIHFNDYKIDQHDLVMGHTFDIRGNALRIADIFFHDNIFKLIKRYLVIPLRPHINHSLDLVNDYLKKAPTIKNIAEIEVGNLSVSKINLTNTEIIVRIAASGKATVRIRPE